MAEGFTRSMLEMEDCIIESAGIKPDGLNQNAVQVMLELGVDISSHKSKTISSIDINHFDLIVTVCDNAHEHCPIVVGKKVLHKNFYDPALAKGSLEEQLKLYRMVRDEIKKEITYILKDYDHLCQEPS